MGRVIVAALLTAGGLATPVATAAGRPPSVLFTDVTTGPASGGVNGHGAPIAIFGSGFGAMRGASTVTIGGVEVASYLVWGERNAHNPTLDMIVVEPGGAVTGGPVVVTVDGRASAPAAAFTVTQGEVYVIAPAGSDSADCRVTTPCRTIAHVANDILRPGDVLLVRGGEYDESEVWLRDEYGDSGTVEQPKVIRRYPGEEPLFSNAARPVIVDAHHVVISGLRFTNGKSVGIGSNERGRTGVRIVDASFEGRIAWDAIGVHGDDHVLAGNVCRVSGSEVGTQGHCYYISFSKRVRLLHNIGTGAPGYGIHVFDQRRQVNDFTRTIEDLVIEGNIVSGSTARSGMILAMGDEDGRGNRIDGVVIRNNVFLGNNHVGLVVGDHVRNVQVLNNTFYRNGRQGIHIGSLATIVGVTVQNNLFDQTANDACTSNCSWYQDAHLQAGLLAQSVSVSRNFYTPGPMVLGSVDTAPVEGAVRFAAPAALDFRVLPGSAVIDAGLAASAVATDYTGLPRPQGGAFDIGAFEFVDEDGAPTPGPAASLALASVVTGRTVVLHWTGTGGVRPPYDLEARPSPAGPVIAATRVAASPLIVPGVGDGVYFVRVRGVSPAGGEVISNQARVVVGTPCASPDVPRGLSARVFGTHVTLAWVAGPGPTPTGYELVAGYAPGQVAVGPVWVRGSPVMTGAPPGRYYVRVRARTACGTSSFSPDLEVIVSGTS